LNTKPFFSSVKQTWKTPKLLYEKLDKEFKFKFDPCPTNADFDGLKLKNWFKCNFVNPPHKTQNLWIWKAIDEMRKGKKTVMLLPARTDTKIFHEYILPFAYEIRFIKGRLHYDEHKNSALFPSMIVIFNGMQICHGAYIESYDYR